MVLCSPAQSGCQKHNTIEQPWDSAIPGKATINGALSPPGQDPFSKGTVRHMPLSQINRFTITEGEKRKALQSYQGFVRKQPVAQSMLVPLCPIW